MPELEGGGEWQMELDGRMDRSENDKNTNSTGKSKGLVDSWRNKKLPPPKE